MGYFQYPTFYSVNCYGGDNKAAALSPGAAHDRRAATERNTESTDEIGSAARRGARSGWRPFMMNEAGVGTPSLPLFCLVFACAKNLRGKRPSIHYLLQGSIGARVHGTLARQLARVIAVIEDVMRHNSNRI